MFKDFTYVKYRELLKVFIKENYKVYTILAWIQNSPVKGILLRHDVDRHPENSLKKALIECELGIKSTYYFRYCSSSLKSDIVSKISSMGHEIGYHYEDLSVANGNYDIAIKLFQTNLERLRQIAEVKTISMHGRPMSKFDNRDIWKKYDFNKFGIDGEAYLTINYKDTYYFSDTGRTWNYNGVNLRDKVDTNIKTELSDTDSLIGFIKDKSPERISVLTHPERWNDNNYLWLKYYSRDMISNSVKRIVNLARNYKD